MNGHKWAHRVSRGRLRRKLAFAAVLGVSDGILNALTLASNAVLHGRGLTAQLGFRVGVVALASAFFTLFVAEYAQYRLELRHAERQLLFTRSGRLASSSLGRAVFRDALVESGFASVASFLGAVTPLIIGVALPQASWVSLAVSVVALGGLGAVLAINVDGRPWLWTWGLICTGAIVTLIGIKVDLV